MTTAQKHVKKSANWEGLWRTEAVVYSPHQILVEKIKELGVKKVIEFGAGSGLDIRELAKNKMDAIFADVSYVASKKYKCRNPSCEVVICDVMKAPFKDGSFEMSYSVGLLEHFERSERKKIIKEMVRVMDNYLLIDVPQKWSLLNPLKMILMSLNKWKFGWETSFSFSEIVDEVQDDNLIVIFRYGRGPLPLPRRFTYKIANIFLKGFFLRFWLKFEECMWWGLFNCCGVLFERRKDTFKGGC